MMRKQQLSKRTQNIDDAKTDLIDILVSQTLWAPCTNIPYMWYNDVLRIPKVQGNS